MTILSFFNLGNFFSHVKSLFLSNHINSITLIYL